MLEFCEAAVVAAHVDPLAIRLHIPQDMRVAEITLADGSKDYEVADLELVKSTRRAARNGWRESGSPLVRYFEVSGRTAYPRGQRAGRLSH